MMGMNTTVLVLNDALSSIESDPDFGRKLASAIRAAHERDRLPIDVSANGFCNAALVIESHHSSHDVTVKIGHNTGEIVR